MTALVRCCVGLPLVEAVVVTDCALRAGAVQVSDLEQAVGAHPARARVYSVLALVDVQSGSVLESVVRVRLLQPGVTGMRSRRVVCDRQGLHVLRTDFCCAEQRLVVETDGSRWHRAERDRRTDNRLAELGWRVLRFSWAEVLYEPHEVVRQVRAALAVDPTRAALARAA